MANRTNLETLHTPDPLQNPRHSGEQRRTRVLPFASGMMILLALGGGCSDASTLLMSDDPAAAPGASSLSRSGPSQVITVTPRVDTLRAIGETLRLSASATNPAGKTQQVSAAWTSADPAVATVDEGGVVTARGPGLVRITARARGQSGSAEVRVELPAASGELRLDVSHTELTLQSGETATLTAALVDESGNLQTGSVTFVSTDTLTAAVDSKGRVTGRAPGRATVRAAARGTHRDVAVRVAERGVETAPVVQQPVSWPGEPAGFTMITDQPWSELPSRGGNAWEWTATSNLAIVADPSTPTSGGRVIRATVPKGLDGRGSHNTWYSFPARHQGYRELYLSAWVKFPKAWQNHLTGIKQLWPDYDGATNQLYTGFSQRSMRMNVNLQGQTWGNRNLRPNMGPAAHHDLDRWRDQWVRLEYYVKMNTVNHAGGDTRRANGVVRMWVTAGGERHQVMNYEDVKFLPVDRNGRHLSHDRLRYSTGTFDGIKWNPTYGGIGDPAPYDMNNYMAHIYVSGR